MSLLRNVARVRPAVRGGGGASTHAISTNFRTNANHASGWGSATSYSFWKGPTGERPVTIYSCHGAMAPRFCSIDPVKHFSTEQYYLKMTPLEILKCLMVRLWGFRIMAFAFTFPFICWMTVAFVNFRREPLETYIEREEYFRDFPSNYYGVYFDHHHFAHRLAVRRANKWHYTNDDLEHAHH